MGGASRAFTCQDESAGPLPEPRDELDVGDLLTLAATRARRYLHTLDARRVAPDQEAIARLGRLAGPLPEGPTAADRLLDLLDTVGSPATTASAGGRYFGFVTGGTLPIALAASWLAGAWDQNAFSRVSSPVAAALEEVALDWLRTLLGLPGDCEGALVTGATMANFTSLAAARHAVLARAGWDVEARGLFGAPPVTVVASAEAHPSLHKALGLLGLGRDRVVRVATDGQGRIRPECVPPLAGPTILCLQAGNVNTGAFDPAHELCPRARDAGAWVHVDGAFGLWALVAPQRAHLARGVTAADSWATDAHKWLNVPYDSGLCFVRDATALRRAMSWRAAYIDAGAAREPMDFTPEASRRARGVELWAVLRHLGRRGLAELVERNCRQAERFATELRAAGHTILNDVVLNQVLVTFGSDAATRAVIARLQDEGTCWCGATVWQGSTAMRISVSSWATGPRDVELSLEAIERAAGALG